jgi:hypothetical protein
MAASPAPTYPQLSVQPTEELDPTVIQNAVTNYLTENPVEAADPRLWKIPYAVPTALWDPAEDPQPELFPVSGVEILSYLHYDLEDGGPLVAAPNIYLANGTGQMATFVEDLAIADRLGDRIYVGTFLTSTGGMIPGLGLEISTFDNEHYFGVHAPFSPRQLQQFDSLLPSPSVFLVTSTVSVPDDVVSGSVYQCATDGDDITVSLPTHDGTLQGTTVYVVNASGGGLGADSVTIDATGQDSYLVPGSVGGATPQWVKATALGVPGGWVYALLTVDPTPETPENWWGTSHYSGIRGQLDDLAAAVRSAVPNLRFLNFGQDPVDRLWNGDHVLEVWDVDTGAGDDIEATLSTPTVSGATSQVGWVVWVHHRAGAADLVVHANQIVGDPADFTLALGESQMFVVNSTGWMPGTGPLG